MTLAQTVFVVPVSEYRLHARALELHGLWTREFASVGELDAAEGELRDIHALASELHDGQPTPRLT